MFKKLLYTILFFFIIAGIGFLIFNQTQQKIRLAGYNYLFSFKNYLESVKKSKEDPWIYNQFLGSVKEIIFPNNNIQDLSNFLSVLGIPSVSGRNNNTDILYRDFLIAKLNTKTQQFHIISEDIIQNFLKRTSYKYTRQLMDPSIYYRLKVKRYHKNIPYKAYDKEQYLKRYIFSNNQIFSIEDLYMRQTNDKLETKISKFVGLTPNNDKTEVKEISFDGDHRYYGGYVYQTSLGTGFVVLVYKISFIDALLLNKILIIILTILSFIIFSAYSWLDKFKRKNEDNSLIEPIGRSKEEKVNHNSNQAPPLEGEYSADLTVSYNASEELNNGLDIAKSYSIEDVMAYLEGAQEALRSKSSFLDHNNIGSHHEYFYKQMKKTKIEGGSNHFIFHIVGSKLISFDQGDVELQYTLKVFDADIYSLKTNVISIIEELKMLFDPNTFQDDIFDMKNHYEGYFYFFNKKLSTLFEKQQLFSLVSGSISIFKKNLLLYRLFDSKGVISLISLHEEKYSVIKHTSEQEKEHSPFRGILKKINPFFDADFTIHSRKLKNREEIYIINEYCSYSVESILGLFKKNQGYFKSIIADIEMVYDKKDTSNGLALVKYRYFYDKNIVDNLPQVIQKKYLGFVEASNEFFRKEMYDNAAESLEKALKIKETEQVYLDLVNTYFLLKDYHKANIVLEKAQKSYPSNEIFVYYQSVSCYRLKDTKNSIRAAMRFYIIEPSNKKNVSNLVQLFKSLT